MRGNFDVDLNGAVLAGVTREKIHAGGSGGASRGHHSRSQSWPVSSFTSVVPGIWREEGEQREGEFDDDDEGQDSTALHQLDLHSTPHSWGDAPAPGMIMGFLVEQRHKSRLEHESGMTMSRSNSCPQLQRRKHNLTV